MASQQPNREELDERARHGETVVPGGTGGKSLEAQEHLAEGNILSFSRTLTYIKGLFTLRKCFGF